MSKRYLIIAIAACVVCLGIGALIGAGIRQSNLAATGGGSASAIEDLIASGANADSMTQALQGMESELQGYAQRVKNVNERKEQARDMLAEIRRLIIEGSLVMREYVYISLRNMIKAGRDDEVHEAIYRDLREFEAMLSFKPGDTLSTAQWEAITAKIEGIVSSLCEASESAQLALRQATVEDFATMDREQLEKARIYYEDKLYVMKDRQETAREALAEMLKYADNYSGGAMTESLYRKLINIYKAREESEELSSRIRGLDKIRKYQPGSIIDSVVWGTAAERLEKVLALFDEAVAFYEPIVDEIWKAIERT